MAKKHKNKSKGIFSQILKETNSHELFQGYTSHLRELFRMLTYCRPHRSATEAEFIANFIDCLPGIEEDGFGNRYVAIAKPDGTPSQVCWTSHTDTVHWDEGRQSIDIADDMVTLHKSSMSSCLGADDTTGVWLMRQMILADVPGFYIFFRGEECGCLGSEYFRQNELKRLANIKAMISLDRKGYYDVITYQAAGKTASNAFARSMAAQLFDKSKPSELGLFTDSNTFADHISECSNLSVGYFDQHGSKEAQDYVFADALLHELLTIDETKLVFEREPGDCGEDYYGSGLYGSHSTAASAIYYDQEPSSDLLTLVKRYPHEIVDLLELYGIDAKEVQKHVDSLWREYATHKDEVNTELANDKSAYGG